MVIGNRAVLDGGTVHPSSGRERVLSSLPKSNECSAVLIVVM